MTANTVLRSAGLFTLLFTLLFAAIAPALAEGPDMEYVGLEGYGVYALAVAPAGQVLAGTSSGVWQTGADGRSISQMSGAGLPVASCSESVAPSDGSDRCFVPSLAVNSRGDVFAVVAPGQRQGQLYHWRAEGGGNTWQPVPAKEMLLEGDDQVIMAAVAPDDTLYAAVKDYRDTCQYTPCVYGVLYRSDDDGETWQEVLYGDYWDVVDEVAISPVGQVWIGGGYLGGRHWMRTSPDAGATWATSTIVPRTGDRYLSEHRTTDFAFGDQGDVCITALGGTAEYPLGVYRSPDNGLSWQRLTPADISQQLWAIAVNGDNHIFYSSWGGILRSTDGGASWGQVLFPVTYPRTYITDLAFDTSGYLWAATDSWGEYGFGNAGLYRSVRPLGRAPQAPTGRQKPVKRQTPEPQPALEMQIFNNWNVAVVYNDPLCEPQFTIWQPYRITYIDTYHWNYGNGTSGDGAISLIGDDDQGYGPWQVSSTQPVYQAQDAIWIVHPDTILPAGTYTIQDSDPSTWSHNPESSGCGFSKVLGYPGEGSRQ